MKTSMRNHLDDPAALSYLAVGNINDGQNPKAMAFLLIPFITRHQNEDVSAGEPEPLSPLEIA